MNVCLHSHIKTEEDNGYCYPIKQEKTVKRERDDDECVIHVLSFFLKKKKKVISAKIAVFKNKYTNYVCVRFHVTASSVIFVYLLTS